MKKHVLFCFFLLFLILNLRIAEARSFDSYSILGLSQSATDSQIQKQYKKLRSKHRNNKAQKNKIKRAYDNIVVQRTFASKKTVASMQETAAMPVAKHIDQGYLYGYKLNDEFDDGRYFNQHFNQTQYILEKMKTSEENKKTARLILMIGSIFLKILPCFLIFFFCRNSGRANSGLHDALARAGAGYANFGRRNRNRP